MFSAMAALLVSYVLCRHVLFGLHWMGQWPLVLFLFGVFLIAVSAPFDARKVMVCTVMGYLLGFVLCVLFGHSYYASVGVMPNGEALLVPRHNGWAFWTFTYLACIVLGIVWEIAGRVRAK